MDQGRFMPGIGLCLCLAIAYPAYAAAIDFQTLTPIELSKTSPSDRAIADFNGDGHLDLVVVMAGSAGGDGGVSVLLGDGSGGFSNRDFPTGVYNAWGVAAGDLNGDGVVDLALTSTVTGAGRASRDVHILLGDGAGAFAEHSTVQALQDAPHAVTIADFDEDGTLDLVVGTTQTTSFHAGSGGGSFAAGQALAGSNNLSGDQLFSADFNNDGHRDVASRQAIYLGVGDGTFTRSAFFSVGAKASADFNGDGRVDMLSAAGSTLQVWFGNGDGTFAMNASITVGADLAAAVAADFDGDGNPDVALASPGDTAVVLLLNKGDGSLSAPQSFATGPEPRLLAAADWNEDGYLDVLAPYNNRGDTPYATRLMQLPSASSPGRLQFGADVYSVSEAGTDISVTVTRTGGSVGSVSIDYITGDGSATAGSDYTFTSGTLNFADGEISKAFSIPVIDDGQYEGDETVNLTLSNAQGGAALGAPSSAVLMLIENDAPPAAGSLQLDKKSYSAAEDASGATITVTRTGGSFGAVSVDYATSDGSAHTASDYTFTSGTLNFADGEISKTFAVALVDDGLYEGNETINVTLSNVQGGATLGTPVIATVTIIDNDPPPSAGSLQFSSMTYTVNEAEATATITVTRIGGSFGTVTVDYASGDLTAAAGSDYGAVSGTLTLTDGVMSATFAVTVLDDSAFEGDESVGLLLSNPTGGAALGAEQSAILAIADDDAPPPAGSLQFSGAGFIADEDAGFATITVTRSGGSFGMVTVQYSTADGTATAGLDYSATSGGLAFADGETTRTFSVPITDDVVYEGDEQLQLRLDSPTDGAVLGTVRDAALTIRENDAPPPAGALQLSSAGYVFNEGDGTVNITITRSGGSAGAVGVDYIFSDGSATGGVDYSTSNGNLLFADGVTSASVSLVILEDLFQESPETIHIALSNATGGAAIGQPGAGEITLMDNEPPPPAASPHRGGGGAVDFLLASVLLWCAASLRSRASAST